MKKLTIIITLFLLILFTFNVNSIENTIEITSENENPFVVTGSETIVKLTIKNNGIRDQILSITPDKFDKFPFSEVFDYIITEPNQIKIKSHKEKLVKIRIRTREDIQKQGRYYNNINIKSLTENTINLQHTISISLITPENIISIEPENKPQLIPGKVSQYQLVLKNNANRDLNNLKIQLESIPYTGEFDIELIGANSKYIADLNIKTKSSSKEGDHDITIKVFERGQLRGSKTNKITLTSNPDIEEQRQINKNFLSTNIKIIKNNIGNEQITKKVKYPITKFQRIFTSTTPEAIILNENENKYYFWSFTLEPDQEYIIEINTDYKVLFVIALLIIFVIGLLSYFKTKNINITKKVFRIKSDKEGISDLKILLHIKNRTMQDIHHIKILDFIPSSAKLSEDFGTLNPGKTEKNDQGIRLTWDILTLEPGEERIISYKIHSKIHISGKMTLPQAIVKYRKKNKKHTQILSNKLTIYAPK